MPWFGQGSIWVGAWPRGDEIQRDFSGQRCNGVQFRCGASGGGLDACFFAPWEGFGGSELLPNVQIFESNRRFTGLFEGPIEDATNSFSSWPWS